MYSLNYISQRVCCIYNFELSNATWFHDNFDPIYKRQEVIINTPYATFSKFLFWSRKTCYFMKIWTSSKAICHHVFSNIGFLLLTKEKFDNVLK